MPVSSVCLHVHKQLQVMHTCALGASLAPLLGDLPRPAGLGCLGLSFLPSADSLGVSSPGRGYNIQNSIITPRENPNTSYQLLS